MLPLARPANPSIRASRQRGLILILALLIVAVVASLAVSFAGQFQLYASRGENRWHGGQARGFLKGAESLAIHLLNDDLRAGTVDHLGETWAQQQAPFEVDGGWLEAHLEDAQGRLNLNSLKGRVKRSEVDKALVDAGTASRFTPAQKRFIRLLQTLDEPLLSTGEAVAITEAVMDWIDSDDSVTGFGGAESEYYQQLEPAYRAANRPFVSVTQLRLVRSVTPELYRAIAPYVVVLPEVTELNINTLSLPLLRTLQQHTVLLPLSVYDAQMILQQRNNKGFTQVAKFLASESVIAALPPGSKIDGRGLSVSSQYFLLHARAQVMQQRRRSITLLRRRVDGVLALGHLDL